MSNIIAAGDQTLTAENAALQALIEQEMEQAREAINFKPAKIGVIHKDKKFRTVDDRLTNTISGVIVYHQKTRGYWENEGDKIPRCSSLDGKLGRWQEGDLSATGGTMPQERPCANCPLNSFGSAEKGAGKACKEMRRLFLVEKGDSLPSILNVPPTSLKAYDIYVSGLLTKRIVPLSLVTAMRLEGASGVGFDYSKIVFERGELLPAKDVLALAKMREAVITAAARMDVETDDYYDPENQTADGTPDGGSQIY